MDELDHLGWVVHRSYEVGGVQFGVRTNSEAGGAWLDETFAEYQVEDETHPYYSLLVSNGDGPRLGRRFHILYEESRALVRTHDLRIAGEALLSQFDQLQARERHDQVYVEAALVRLGDVVGLVPSILPPYLSTLGHRVLDRSGLELPITTHVALDTVSSRVVNQPRTLRVPADAVDRLAGIVPSNGRQRVAAAHDALDADVVCLLGLADEPVRRVSAGQVAHVLSTRILNLDFVGGTGIETVARLAGRTRCTEIHSSTPKETLEALLQALQPA